MPQPNQAPNEKKYVNQLPYPGSTPSEALEEWDDEERRLELLFQAEGARDAFFGLNVSPEVIEMAMRLTEDVCNGSDRNTRACYLNDFAEFAQLIIAHCCKCNGETNETLQ
jgi:hypothetical protein